MSSARQPEASVRAQAGSLPARGVQLPRWVRTRALRFAPFVEPTAFRHALVRDAVYVLRQPRVDDGFHYDVAPLFAHRCIFFHLPKTGGLSVSEALFGNHAAGHLDVKTAKLIFGAWRLRTYFKFTFVRNPWDRLVSAYYYLRRGHRTSKIAGLVAASADFNEFVKTSLRNPLVAQEVHIRPQSSFLLDTDGRMVADFVGRFESLERDFSTVAQRLGIDRALQHRNQSEHRDYRNCYDAESHTIVADFYRKDIDLFGYRFDR